MHNLFSFTFYYLFLFYFAACGFGVIAKKPWQGQHWRAAHVLFGTRQYARIELEKSTGDVEHWEED